jgi:hypothetical protein
MGEPERRRRRLRPSAATAEPATVPAGDDAPADRPADPVARAAVPSDPALNRRVVAEAEVTEPVVGTTAAIADLTEPAEPGERMSRPGRGVYSRRPTSGAGAGGDEREMERGLRGLVGSGSSQVSVGAALRARDAARPTDEQLADADENLVIVRRNWIPREELPRNR